MAEDDSKQAPQQAAEETATDKPSTPEKIGVKTAAKKKTARKKAPAVKVAATKQTSVKKKAAPKKKAARKSRAAAGMEKAGDVAQAAATQTPTAVVESKQVPAAGKLTAMADTATVADEAAKPAITAEPTNPPVAGVAEPTVKTATAAPTSDSAEPSPEETPHRNENVQKRLEEMGLMPSDSTEKQTPPPAKRTGSALGFWQKSFILAIVVVAGLLYIFNVADDGGGVADSVANNAVATGESGQVTSAENAPGEVTVPVTPVPDQPTPPAPLVAGPSGSEPEQGTSDLTAVTPATAPVTPAALAADPTPPVSRVGEAAVAGPGEAMDQQTSALATNQPISGDSTQPVIEEREQPTAAAGSADTDTPAMAAGETAVTETAAGTQTAAAITGTTGTSAQTAPQSAMASADNRPAASPMMPRPGGLMAYRPGAGYPIPAAPGARPAETGNPQGGQQPEMGWSRYPVSRQPGYATSGYSWGYNPPMMPYYWPYPPRPPGYGLAVGYPYHYPQMPR
jgi:hypothetical protein